MSYCVRRPKLYDTLVAMQADGLALPPGATKEVLDVVWAQVRCAYWRLWGCIGL